MSLSVRCPIVKTRIRYAVKGKRCRHAQAFDLNAYVQMNHASRKYLCPVCGQSTLTLVSDPVTQAFITMTDRLYPMDKFKDLTREDTIQLLTKELKAA